MTARDGLITFGETMGLVTADEPGPLEATRTLALGIGGAESNVAIGVRRLGGCATWFGRVGSDAVGTMIERRLLGEGVRALVIRDPGFTGLMVKHRRFGTRVSVDYHRAGSAGSRLRPEDVPADELERAALLHLTGITPALSETARDATLRAVALARQAGVAISLDVNYRSKLWSAEAARPLLRELVAQADVVFAGADEACVVLGDEGTPRELARGLAALGPGEVVLKLGERGCLAAIDGHEDEVPARPAAVVDPVGAGDAFVAGYLAERLRQAPPAQRLATAVAAGACAVSVPGDCEGMPWRDELDALAGAEEEVAR
jgi:2-dehydro-3-deoxygluconokinase